MPGWTELCRTMAEWLCSCEGLRYFTAAHIFDAYFTARDITLVLALILILPLAFSVNVFAQQEQLFLLDGVQNDRIDDWFLACDNLIALIEEARAIEMGSYTNARWNALQAAIQDAQTLLRNTNATKE